METETVDETYQLKFKTNSGKIIIVNDELLDKIENYDNSSFPEGTKIIRLQPSIFDIHFANKNNLKIFRIPIICKIKISQVEKKLSLYSFRHLKLCLNKLKKEYTNPYFYSSYSRKNIYINDSNIEEIDFSYETEIEIKEKKKEDEIQNINNIYTNINNIYIENSGDMTYEYISPNYNKYFPKMTPENLSDKFNYIYSNNRKKLESNFKLFLDNKEEMIYPICGPHNIGKTITSLIIQKMNFFKGIKSLYLNLKYYLYEPLNEFETKIETLLKECCFFIENEQELLDLYNDFKKINGIDNVILFLNDYLISNNYSDKKFFLILDQYQAKYDYFGILTKLSKFKIFLLSSINDHDVKQNLIITYQDKKKQKKYEEEKKVKIISYTYYENLFDFQSFNKNIYENKIRNKLQTKEKKIEDNRIQEKFNFIKKILKQFNFIPKYYFGFIYNYNTIYDLMFYEFIKIFSKLYQFNLEETINRSKITILLDEKCLIEKNETDISNYKTLSKEEYIEYLKFIPLKYINYHLNEKGELYFYYSFPLLKDVLKNFLDYYDSKETFKISKDGSIRGKAFEKIIKIQFRVFNKFNIDGHLEVNSIINMDFTENYKLFDEDYIKGKKNILITQKNEQGRDYDFAIYMPKSHQLLLIQVKYQIENKLIKDKTEYLKTCKNVLTNCINAFHDNDIKNVYLLYISSEEYNNNRKKTVKFYLDKHKINCLFYSVTKDLFTFNFEKKIENLELENSFMLLPKIKDYVSQDIIIEKKEKEHKKNQILLGKKRKKPYNMDEIYETLKDYFSSQNIGFSMGKINEIGFIFDDFKVEINREKNYVVIFSLKKEDESMVDLEKQIGLIYYEHEQGIFLEVTKKKFFSNFEELFEIFTYSCYYGIGEK